MAFAGWRLKRRGTANAPAGTSRVNPAEVNPGRATRTACRPGSTPERVSGDRPVFVLSTQTWAPRGSVAISMAPVWREGGDSADGPAGPGARSATKATVADREIGRASCRERV